MNIFSSFGRKLKQLCSASCCKISCFCRSTWFLILYFYRYVILRMNKFSIELFYFLFVSTIGFAILKALKPRTFPTFTPRNLDLFFTSVSAATVSSMSTVEMEVFSNSQLLIMTLLMFIGSEVFTSMVGLHLRCFSLLKSSKDESKVNSSSSDLDIPSSFHDQLELGIITRPEFESSKSDILDFGGDETLPFDMEDLRYKSIKFLGYVVLGYLLVINFLGVVSVLIYVNAISSAKNVLKKKGLNSSTFSLFTTVSTFASCGFVPTNENMMIFSKNSGLLLILIPQVLLGNTLFPSFLRFSVWFLGKFVKKMEVGYLLKNERQIGYHHFLSFVHSSLLVVTVVVFIGIQFVLFCSMEWNTGSLSGLNSYQKVVGVLFQSVNTRHTGETVVDLSTVAAAVLVLFVVMMYLPPYTSFLPMIGGEENGKRMGKMMDNLIFSQLSYLVIFIILVCITERNNIKEDPLNFNVLNIVVEVISAYGNVGFTTGYNCDRRLKTDGFCENKWYGFSGKWSDEGKIVLICIMFFGRLKKFNMNGGKAWKLL